MQSSRGLPHKNKANKLQRAAALHKRGQLRQAARQYDDILKRDPGNIIAHQLRAQIHYRAGQTEAALKHLSQALSYNDSHASMWFDLGNAYLKLDRKEEAVAAYSAGLSREPNNTSALNNCAATLKALGRLDEAIEKYDRALFVAQNDVNILLNMGNTYKEANRPDDAIMIYRRAVAVEPDNMKALLSLGLTLLDQKNINEAHACLKKVVSIAPNQPDALRGLSAILGMLGDVNQAIASTRKAAQFKTPTIRHCSGLTRGRILVLSCVENRWFKLDENWRIGSPADNNLKEYIDLRKFDAVELHVEYFENDRAALDRLPPPSLILNTIAEADDKGRALSLAGEIIDRMRLPAINLPSVVLETTRDRNSAKLSNIPGLIFPKTNRINPCGPTARDIWSDLEAEGFTFPVIVREPGSHLGTTMALIHNLSEMESFLLAHARGELYVIQYYESPRPFGFHRRFRVFFLEGKPYPANCYFGTGWNVHREESDKLADANRHLQAMEETFLLNPESEIGAQNYQLLRTLPEIIDLDYFGVDFNMTHDGTLLIYETNAAMAHRSDREDDFPYLAPHFDRFKEGLEAMILRKIASA